MDSSVLSIMVPAFVQCLVLVGIHAYLGLHVIKRKVIFVDLALAQIAALGATVGFLFGMDPTSNAAFIFSLLFTFAGAAIFSLSRLRNDRVPQEAVIGLVYALAAAVTILVIDKSPHGAEHIKDLLTGTILWVKWHEVLISALAYSLVGLFHFILRQRFIRISEDPEKAFESGMWVRMWDFLFYVSFGFVITISVHTAGVLLVFVFLVAPAITAVLLADRWSYQLLIGWVMGAFVTGIALYLSYVFDLPSGPTVVALYGVVLLLVFMAVSVLHASHRGLALRRLALAVALTLVGLTGMWGLGTVLGSSSLAVDHGRRQPVTEQEQQAPGDGRPAEVGLSAGGADAIGAQAADPEARLARLKSRVATRSAGWSADLVEAVLDANLPLLYRDEALEILRSVAGDSFSYDPAIQGTGEDAERLRAWARRQAMEK